MPMTEQSEEEALGRLEPRVRLILAIVSDLVQSLPDNYKAALVFTSEERAKKGDLYVLGNCCSDCAQLLLKLAAEKSREEEERPLRPMTCH